MGTKVPEEKKQAFLNAMGQIGLNQSEGLEYAMDMVLNRTKTEQMTNENPHQSSALDELLWVDQESTAADQKQEASSRKFVEPEEDMLSSGFNHVLDLFEEYPLRSTQAECEIKNAWKTALNSEEKAPLEVLFLEELSSRLLELRMKREGYSCPKAEIGLPDRIVELVQSLHEDAEVESETSNPDEILLLMGNLAASKAENMYNANREIVLGFSRSDWRLLDRLMKRENKNRSKSSHLPGLRELIYEFLANKVKEHSSAGFFNSAEPEMLELAQGLKNISASGKRRSYE